MLKCACLPLEDLAGLELPGASLFFSAGFCQPGIPCSNLAKLTCFFYCSCCAEVSDDCYPLPPTKICAKTAVICEAR